MRQRCPVVIAALGCFLLLAGCARSQLPHPLSSYVVTNAAPYAAWPEDPRGCSEASLPCSRESLAEKKSGPLNIHAYADCDGVSANTLRHDHWEASYLRNWVDRTASPEGVINLCVTEFVSTADARMNYFQAKGSHAETGPGLTPLTISGISPMQAYSWTIPNSPIQLVSVVFQSGGFTITIESSGQTYALGPTHVGHSFEATAIVTRLAESEKSHLAKLG